MMIIWRYYLIVLDNGYYILVILRSKLEIDYLDMIIWMMF